MTASFCSRRGWAPINDGYFLATIFPQIDESICARCTSAAEAAFAHNECFHPSTHKHTKVKEEKKTENLYSLLIHVFYVGQNCARVTTERPRFFHVQRQRGPDISPHLSFCGR